MYAKPGQPDFLISSSYSLILAPLTLSKGLGLTASWITFSPQQPPAYKLYGWFGIIMKIFLDLKGTTPDRAA